MAEAVIAAAAFLGLGVGAQVLAARLHVPGILLLLLVGFAAGPGLGLLHPDEVFGDLLPAFVGLSVAVILFEGGLTLRFSEIRAHGLVVARLVSTGAFLVFLIAAAAATLFMPLELAFLLGAIMIVSGPTVVQPLLRHVRPASHLDAVLRWEGILIDPIGAILAVLVFEVITATTAQGIGLALTGLVGTLGIGLLLGLLGAVLIVVVESRYLVPDRMAGALGLATVVVAYAASEVVRAESGLLAVTVMGIALANQRRVNMRHLLDFKETLAPILLGTLFVVLASRLSRAEIALVDWRMGVFLAVLVLVARPIAVAWSARGSKLSWKDKAFLAWVAPRGIVAAAVAAFFALRLEERGIDPGALVPATFFVILGTVLLYGLTARPLGRWLGVAGPAQRGVVVIGANRVGRALAKALQDTVPVVLLDNDAGAVAAANVDGLTAHKVELLAPDLEAIELNGIGRLWAVMPSEEANVLASLRFMDRFGRGNVGQIPVETVDREDRDTRHLRGQFLFGGDLVYRTFRDRLQEGWDIRGTAMTDHFTYQDHRAVHVDGVPLFLVEEGRVRLFTDELRPDIRSGVTLYALVPPEEKARPK